MKGLWQDLRYAIRMLAKSPGYTAISILLLTVGIGVTTTVFSIVDCMILRPMPIAEPNRMVRFYAREQEQTQSFSYPEYEEIREQSGSFSGILASSRREAILRRSGEIEIIRTDIVSDNYFTVLGIQPMLGQSFTAHTGWAVGDMPEAVISHGLWHRYFASDPDIVGKTINVNGESAVVRGVVPPSFGGLQRGMLITEMWLPANQWPSYGQEGFSLRGRLNRSVKLKSAQQDLDTIARHLEKAYPDTNRDRTYLLSPLEMGFLQSLLSGTLFLSGPFLILLICCANIAGMGLARTEDRRREMAIRLSLGAGRRRLFRQLSTESVVLAIPGTALGLLLTHWLISLQSLLLPPVDMVMRFDLRVDMRVLVFAVGISIAAVLLSAFTPALQAVKTELSALLKGSPGKTESGKQGLALRNLLVGGQIALSLTLFIAGGLFLKSLLLSEQSHPGFDSGKKILAVNTASSIRLRELNQKLFIPAVEHIKALPGVKGASYAARMLLSSSGGGRTEAISIPGIENPPDQKGFMIKWNSVGQDYFKTVGTNILRGRPFNTEDESPQARSVIINETMGKRFWPNADPIGKFITASGEDYRIIGIAQDAKINKIHEVTEPYLYFSFAQFPLPNVSIIVETSGDPLDMADAVKHEIHTVDNSIVFLQTETLDDIMGLALYLDRMTALGSGIVGILAILLTAVGLYGILAYMARRRTREIGIRMALGAQIQDISRLVIGNGFRITVVGIATGLMISFFAMRLISSLLYGVAPTDIWIYLLGSAVVFAISVLAGYIPARKALRVDPMKALRYE